MRSIRTAVIGLGEFGVRHLDVLTSLGGVEVVAIASRSEQRAHELAAKYAVPGVFADCEALLGAVELDTIHVVTEDTRHFAPVLASLRAGVDVFVEKPLSNRLDEAREMVAEAQRLGRRLMVGHILRFDPRYAAVKEKAARGELGRLCTVYGRRNMCKLFQPQYTAAHRLFTTGIHDIDIILWLYEGRRPFEVYMKSLDVLGQGDDVFWGLITMDDGSLGIVESNWVLPEGTPWRGHILMQAIGTAGTALIEVPGDSLSFWLDSGVEVPDTTYWPIVHGAAVGALRDEIAYFVRCVRERRPVEIPRHDEVLASLEVVTALIQSAEQRRPVRL